MVSWVHSVVLQYIILFSSRRNLLHICKAWNVILLGLGPEFGVWMHKRGVKCNTFGLLTQFKILATPARQVQTNEPRRAEQEPACTATAEKIQHTGLHNYKQPSRTFRQKCRILLLIPKIMFQKSETLGQRYLGLIYDLLRTLARLFRGQHVAEC